MSRLLFLLILFIVHVKGQEVVCKSFSGGALGEAQMLDIKNEDCNTLTGDVEIESENLVDITKINGTLSNFKISFNTVLKSLSGLHNLVSVDDKIEFTVLESLFGLDTLVRVGGATAIYSNAELKSIAALNNLNQTSSVSILGNKVLDSLSGLNGLRQLETLNVEYSEALKSLSGLNGLREIGVLTNLKALFLKLQKIQHNPVLESISELNCLQSITLFAMTNNPMINCESNCIKNTIYQINSVSQQVYYEQCNVLNFDCTSVSSCDNYAQCKEYQTCSCEEDSCKSLPATPTSFGGDEIPTTSAIVTSNSKSGISSSKDEISNSKDSKDESSSNVSDKDESSTNVSDKDESSNTNGFFGSYCTILTLIFIVATF